MTKKTARKRNSGFQYIPQLERYRLLGYNTNKKDNKERGEDHGDTNTGRGEKNGTVRNLVTRPVPI